MALILKIGFPPGSNLKYKLTKFKQSLSVKEAIEEIVKTNKLTHPEQYVLLLPPPSPGLSFLCSFSFCFLCALVVKGNAMIKCHAFCKLGKTTRNLFSSSSPHLLNSTKWRNSCFF